MQIKERISTDEVGKLEDVLPGFIQLNRCCSTCANHRETCFHGAINLLHFTEEECKRAGPPYYRPRFEGVMRKELGGSKESLEVRKDKMGVEIDEDGRVVLKRRKQLHEVVRAHEHKKVVKIAVDEDTGDELYEHIGGKGGLEWHTGVFVVERGVK